MSSEKNISLMEEPVIRFKSKTQQARERFELFMRRFLTRTEYELYGFGRSDKDYSYMLNFLTIHDIRNNFRYVLNDVNWKLVLDNKWFFHLHYSKFGIPLPKTYGVYQPGGGLSFDGKPLGNPEQLRLLLDQVRATSLVIKPVGGIMGRGLLILTELRYERGGITAVTNDGHVLSFDDIALRVDTPPNVGYQMRDYTLDLPGYLIQAKLQQHEFLNNIAPYTLNTIRVVTFVDRGNKAHVQCTALRVGRRGHAGDNWDQGGVSIALDRSTGMLGQGVLKPKYGGQWVKAHPDSGVVFQGLQMPQWDQILELSLRAARVSPNLRSVGWDVALTPDGPVIIEGNPDWGLLLVQVHTHGLLQPEVREQLAQFGITFPRDKMPPINLGQWRVWLRDKQSYRRSANRTLPRRLVRLFNRDRIYRKLKQYWNTARQVQKATFHHQQ